MTLPLHSRKDLTARIMQEKIYSLLQLNGRISKDEFPRALNLAKKGIMEIYKLQREALKRKYSATPQGGI